MAEAKKTTGFLVIERHEGVPDRMTFHEDDASVQREVSRALRQNETVPPPLSETDVIVIPAARYRSA